MFSKRQWLVQEPLLQKDSVSQTLLNRLRNFSISIINNVFIYSSFNQKRNVRVNHINDEIKLKFANEFWIDIDVLPKNWYSNSVENMIISLKMTFFV